MRTLLVRALCGAALAVTFPLGAAQNQLLGWNNLGMHCMDSDYSVFSILPPYNTIHAQLIVGGRLLTNANGYAVTYQAMADPDGSFNATAMGKGNFYEFAAPLYGANPGPEGGLAGWSMPGLSNAPQSMLFEATNRPAPGVATRVHWFRAEGIPISPFDDAGRKNPYPLMRLVARNGSGVPLATNDIVLPVSDEMDCRACHASGTQAAARPSAGWTWSSEPERDYRLNILRLHDEHQFARHPGLYQAALAARGLNAQGLYRGVVADGRPVLCASCHASEALGTGSYSNIPPLTASVHATHAAVQDPELHVPLDDASHRAACYRCHPGSTTKCLRGAMGGAVAGDGTLSMQCQSCHGNMSQVGSRDRVGWFMEPNCQGCHTGDAVRNNGRMRYTSVFEPDGRLRVVTNTLFATPTNTPAPGLSLYRFSAGHGGLQCSACHGSTHAEFPATHRNDNLRNIRIQGHGGVTAECTACHGTVANNATTATGGPHGMHPVGQGWVEYHHDTIHSDTDHLKCAGCHGADFRGSELSRAFGPRTVTANLDGGSITLNLFQGAMVGCYSCHNGPRTSRVNTNAAPFASNLRTNTTSGRPVDIPLPVSGLGASARLLAQPAHGTVGLSNGVATYFPDPGFVGEDEFAYAAWNGQKNSGRATGTVTVGPGPFSIAVNALVPPAYPAGWPVPFSAVAAPSNTVESIAYEWDFGDGSALNTNRYASHAYAAPGVHAWSLTVRVGTAQASARGTVTISEIVRLGLVPQAGAAVISWPQSPADAVLEHSPDPGRPGSWPAVPGPVTTSGGRNEAAVAPSAAAEFFRLRQVK